MTETTMTETTMTKTTTGRRKPARDKLVETATRLFNEGGYHATGIDRILDEAGVAKMTLYNNFPSKDDLILEVLRRRGGAFRDWLVAWVGRTDGADPLGRVLAVFDALAAWHHSASSGPGLPFKGCIFVRAAGEFPDPGHPVHRVAGENKQAVIDLLRDLVVDLLAANFKASDPQKPEA